MSKSYIIKKNLLKEFIININSLCQDKTELFFSSEMKKGLAATLLSVVNYGFNVANRRELPTADTTYLDTETALSLTESNLDWEERYIRNEISHPSRHIYTQVADILKSIGVDKDKIAIIENQLVDKNKLGDLGKLKTPEEVLGELFIELDPQQILEVCSELVKINLASLPENQSRDQPESKLLITDPQETVLQSDFKHNSNFRLIMAERLKRVEQVGTLLKSTASTVLPYEAPDTKYPCIIFCLRNLAKRVGCDKGITMFPSDRYTSLNKCIMSYFCGLVNFYSQQFYGEKFIYVQPIVSFGSLRPTLCASGRTFRFSLGVVPENFSEVIKAAYSDVVNVLEDKDGEVIKKLKSLFHHSHAQSKMDQFFYHKTANETCQLIVFGLGASKGSPQDLFLNYLNSIENFSLDTQEILKQRQENFKAGTESKIVSPKIPEAPAVLSGLLEQLIRVAELRIFGFERNYSLKFFDKAVKEELIIAVKSGRNIENYYNDTVSAIETLSRLLKLDYELEIVYESECRGRLTKDELELPKLERSVSTSSEEAYPVRSGMEGVSDFFTMYLGHEEKSITKEIISTDELYFEYSNHLIAEIAKISSKVAKITLKEIPKGNDMSFMHFADVRPFPKKPISQSKATDWEKIFTSTVRPEVLLVDITSATLEDIEDLYKRFNQNNASPHLLIMFSSDNKFAQMGIDLVCMGEIRVYSKPISSPSLQEKNVTDLYEKLKAVLDKAVPINSVSAKAYRRLITDVEQRRGLNITTGLQRSRMINIPKIFTDEIAPLYKHLGKDKITNEKLRNVINNLTQQIKPELVQAVMGFIYIKFSIISNGNCNMSNLIPLSEVKSASFDDRLDSMLKMINPDAESSITSGVKKLVTEFGDEAFFDDFSESSQPVAVTADSKESALSLSGASQLIVDIEKIQKNSDKEKPLFRYYQDILLLLQDDLAEKKNKEIAETLQKMEKENVPDLTDYVKFFRSCKRDTEFTSSQVCAFFKR